VLDDVEDDRLELRPVLVLVEQLLGVGQLGDAFPDPGVRVGPRLGLAPPVSRGDPGVEVVGDPTLAPRSSAISSTMSGWMPWLS